MREARLNGASVRNRLAACLRRGEVLDLIPEVPFGSSIPPEVMQRWDQSHQVDADDLRDLLCGRVVSDPDPQGLRLRGARIPRRLNLDNLNTSVKLTLLDCLLEEGLTAEAARLPALILQRCVLVHPSIVTLYADGLQIDAEVSLSGSRIAAQTTEGAVRIIGARIGGQLDCSGTGIVNDAGPALDAGSLKVDGDVFLSDESFAHGKGPDGAVRLPGAHITGQLDCSGAMIQNPSGPALFADSLKVDDDVHLTGPFTALGADSRGAVRLPQARITGQLDCTGATIQNSTGPALIADRSQAHDILLRAGFTASGDSEAGAVQLNGVRVSSDLDCTGATIQNPSGPALDASNLKVDGDVHLTENFKATGAGPHSAVQVPRARISGELDCSAATIVNPAGPALDMDSLKVGGDLRLSEAFKAEGTGRTCIVRLSGVQIGGRLDYRAGEVVNQSDPQSRWHLDGLTYTGLPLGLDRAGWLALFREATPTYAAQPYQQLASVYRAAGHDSDVREILIAQRQAQLDRKVLTNPGERLWARITGATLGYGYRPWRALLFLSAVVAVSTILAVSLGTHGALSRPPEPDRVATTTASSCTLVEQIGVGLDLGIPFLATQVRGHCALANNTTGNALAISQGILQLMAAGFGALFVAGFTSIVRKT